MSERQGFGGEELRYPKEPPASEKAWDVEVDSSIRHCWRRKVTAVRVLFVRLKGGERINGEVGRRDRRETRECSVCILLRHVFKIEWEKLKK